MIYVTLFFAGLLCPVISFASDFPSTKISHNCDDFIEIAEQILQEGNDTKQKGDQVEKYQQALTQCLSHHGTVAKVIALFDQGKGKFPNGAIHDPMVYDFNCQTHSLIYLDCLRKSKQRFALLDEKFQKYLIAAYILTKFRYSGEKFVAHLLNELGVMDDVNPSKLIRLLQLYTSDFAVSYLLAEVDSLEISNSEKLALKNALKPMYFPYQRGKRSGLRLVRLYPSAFVCLMLAKSKEIPITVELHRFVDKQGEIERIGSRLIYYKVKNGTFIPLRKNNAQDSALYLFKMYSIYKTDYDDDLFCKSFSHMLLAKNIDNFASYLNTPSIEEKILSTAVNAQQYGPIGGGVASTIEVRKHNSLLLNNYNMVILEARKLGVNSPLSFKTCDPKPIGCSVPFNTEHVLVRRR